MQPIYTHPVIVVPALQHSTAVFGLVILGELRSNIEKNKTTQYTQKHKWGFGMEKKTWFSYLEKKIGFVMVKTFKNCKTI